MKVWCIVSIMILSLVLFGCSDVDLSKVSDEDMQRISDNLVVCKTPYIRLGTGCCLDANNNSICDSDDINKTEIESLEVQLKECVGIYRDVISGISHFCYDDSDCLDFITNMSKFENFGDSSDFVFKCVDTKFSNYVMNGNVFYCSKDEDCYGQLGVSYDMLLKNANSNDILDYVYGGIRDSVRCYSGVCQVTNYSYVIGKDTAYVGVGSSSGENYILVNTSSEKSNCVINSDCPKMKQCIKGKCEDCIRECETNLCDGKNFIQCLFLDSDYSGCSYTEYKGITYGECGVQCLNNSNCKNNKICKNNLCVDKECMIIKEPYQVEEKYQEQECSEQPVALVIENGDCDVHDLCKISYYIINEGSVSGDVTIKLGFIHPELGKVEMREVVTHYIKSGEGENFEYDFCRHAGIELGCWFEIVSLPMEEQCNMVTKTRTVTKYQEKTVCS